MIPVEKIGRHGRSVKCAKCAHTWRVMPSKEEIRKVEEKQKEGNTKLGSSTSVPAVSDISAPFFLKILPLFILLLIIIVSFIFFKNTVSSIPGLGSLYSVFGVFETEGVNIQDLKIKKIKNSKGRVNLRVKGSIVNNSKYERKAPHLRAVIISTRGDKIFNHTIKSSGKILKPKQKLPINFTLSNLHPKAEIVELDIGNGNELFMR